MVLCGMYVYKKILSNFSNSLAFTKLEYLFPLYGISCTDWYVFWTVKYNDATILDTSFYLLGAKKVYLLILANNCFVHSIYSVVMGMLPVSDSTVDMYWFLARCSSQRSFNLNKEILPTSVLQYHEMYFSCQY